jgi:uncharacterized protein
VDVLLSGSHGLIGSALLAELTSAGHKVTTLERSSRSEQRTGTIHWDPGAGVLDRRDLEEIGRIDAVVHLAGAGIGDARWTEARKKVLVESRTLSTALLSRRISELDPKPDVMICASAIGIYGSRGDERLTEESNTGSDFLAELCKQWESSAESAVSSGIRVVNLRSGVVLSSKGGALTRQIPLFRFGLGGRLGNGRQYSSWIALEDEVRAIRHLMETSALSGPINATAPNPVTNSEFTKTLAKVLHRPALLKVPPFGLSIVFGPEMAEEMILASQRVSPARLVGDGFEYRFPELDTALRATLA